jgi:hypothetical protein
MKQLRILVLFFFLATSLWAASSIEGPTGLITIPTAEALRFKEIAVAYDYVFSPVDSSLDRYFYKIHAGTYKGLELGFVGGTVPTEGVFVNAKYYLMSDGSRYPISIAIGTKNLGSKYNTDVYMVASKRFEGGIMAHFGFNANFGKEKLDQSIIGGLEYLLTDRISLLGDISQYDKEYTVNGGVVLYIGENLLLRGSVLDVGNKDSGTIYTMGVSYIGFL